MLFGKRDLAIFGNTPLQSTQLGVIQHIDLALRRLYFNQGEVDGVGVNDEYAVHPRGSLDLSQITAKVKVKAVHATGAIAELPEVAGVEQGCPVSLVKPAVANATLVRVQSPQLLQALQQQPVSGIQFCADDFQAAAFHVLSLETSHQITDAAGTTLRNCPLFAADGEEAAEIYAFLRKLAHYRMVMQLYNKSSQLNGKFVFHEHDGTAEVFHGGIINLEVENLRPKPANPLYFSILNLRSNWEVALLVPDPVDRVHSIPVEGGGKGVLYGSGMTIPNDEDSEVGDIFKVIVTTQSTQFLKLDTTGGAMRGGGDLANISDELEDMLQGGDGDRGGSYTSKGDWQTATVYIRIIRRQQG